MKLPNNGDDRAQTLHFSSPNEVFTIEDGLHLIGLAKGVPWEATNNQAVAKSIGSSPQTDSKVPFLKKTSTHLVQHGKVNLVPVYSLRSYRLVCMVPERAYLQDMLS